MAKVHWDPNAAAPAKSATSADADRGWVGLRDLDTASKLAQKRSETEALRTHMKREWALNRTFYNGHQWAFWNQSMLRVEDIPVDSGPRWKIRLQSNQIKPGLAHYVAQLTKTRPTINAIPDSGRDQDIKSAQMGEALFEYAFATKQLNSKVKDAMTEAGLSGGYWLITWDSLAGIPMTFTMDPTGNPIVDDELSAAYIDQFAQKLDEQGIPEKTGQTGEELARQYAEKTVYLGDFKVEVMTGENVLLDPSVSRFEDAKWVICRHLLDPDEIHARFGVVTTPNASRSTDSPVPFTEDKRPHILREVFVMYIRPCPSLPKGRYVAWIEGPNQILQDMAWPFPFQILPMCKFPGLYRPGSPYDDPIVTDARPLQKDIADVIDLIYHPDGEQHPDDMETDNDGQLVIYTGIYRHSDGSYHGDAEEKVGGDSDLCSV